MLRVLKYGNGYFLALLRSFCFKQVNGAVLPPVSAQVTRTFLPLDCETGFLFHHATGNQLIATFHTPVWRRKGETPESRPTRVQYRLTVGYFLAVPLLSIQTKKRSC